MSRVELAPCWRIYEPRNSAPWNLERVVRLHRRAGFGATRAELDRDLADGPATAIDRLLAADGRAALADFEATAAVVESAAIDSGDAQRVEAAWLLRMLLAPDPLRERMTLFWHDHFATSNLKVRNLARAAAQITTLRRLALDRFDSILDAMIADPALLIWLDAIDNVKGRPNQNLARELLELFTVGVPNFREDDVLETARALTGWRLVNGEARFERAAKTSTHDDGEKTILGATAPFDPRSLARHLAEHPATARRLTTKLVRFFVADSTDAKVVAAADIEGLAQEFVHRERDIRWLVSTILRSEVFASEGVAGRKVIDPTAFVIGAVRALERFDPAVNMRSLASWTARLGQRLYHPPNVGGWPGGLIWLDPRSVAMRAQFAEWITRDSAMAESTTDLTELAGRFATTWLGHVPGPPFVDDLLADLPTDETPVRRTELVASRVLAAPEAQIS